ncbi:MULTISPECIES: hypothetical protein [unclassified Streptomyces]|uniref:hypothetical protein n=1 Tax=unclassified Streptomyces TaxID=2593676 RepID=UPI00278C2023|nr:MULTISPECIES: hypothetical protein [unclassified Streptomyces]
MAGSELRQPKAGEPRAPPGIRDERARTAGTTRGGAALTCHTPAGIRTWGSEDPEQR